MSVVSLCWYICGVSVFIAAVASAISYHPEIQYMGVVLPAVFGGIGLLAGGAALRIGRLPPEHRIHHSKPLWIGLVAAAVTVTMLVILAG